MAKVTFETDSKNFEVEPGTALLDVCHNNNVGLPFGCEQGNCGTCVFTPVTGGENLAPPSENEKMTLETVADDPAQRLACQCVVNGDVTIKY